MILCNYLHLLWPNSQKCGGNTNSLQPMFNIFSTPVRAAKRAERDDRASKRRQHERVSRYNHKMYHC
jgi:hypothetical protein